MPLRLDPGTRLVAATHNPGKARELHVLLDGRFDVVSAGQLGLPEPDEPETTFIGNAMVKARAAADASGLIALADDSGISVAALGGQPGVHSARWAGPEKDFDLAMRKVEQRLNEAGSDDLAAWFTSALAVAWPGGPVVVVEGRIDGALTFPKRGAFGFGYDPIFVPEGFDKTFGELTADIKDRISHRARAFEKLKAALFSTRGPRTPVRPIPRPRLADAEPLAVYVHWPYCTRICPYCDFNVVRDRGRSEQQALLAGAILADLQGHRSLTGPRRLVSIYLGGGTPSLLPPEWAEAIIGMARNLWPTDGQIEVTLEANPTDVEAGRFAAFAGAGVTRLSLGLQALDDTALEFLGRDHTAREGIRAAAIARTVFPRLSLDLIYARPGQTPWAWAAELETATALGAEHISPYQLTIENGTAFGRAVRRGQWAPPDPDAAAAMFETTQQVLGARGYDAYEVSNHAHGEEARSRHNLAYWRGHDYVGVGPGAHGRLTLGGARTAVRAAAKPADYIQSVRDCDLGWAEQEVLSPRQVAEERLLTGLRTSEGVELAELAVLGLQPGHPKLSELGDAGLLRLERGRLVATPEGRLVLDRVTLELIQAG